MTAVEVRSGEALFHEEQEAVCKKYNTEKTGCETDYPDEPFLKQGGDG